MEAALTFIDTNKGEKWRITSNSDEILDNYGRDTPIIKLLDYVLFQKRTNRN